MIRNVSAALLASLLATAGSAQTLRGGPELSTPTDPQVLQAFEEYEALMAELDAEYQVYLDKLMKLDMADNAAEKQALRAREFPLTRYEPRFVSAVQKYQSTPGEVFYLSWFVDSDQVNGNLARRAIELFLSEHIESEWARCLVTESGKTRLQIYDRNAFRDNLRRLIDESPHDKLVRAPAMYHLAIHLLGRPQDESDTEAGVEMMRQAAEVGGDSLTGQKARSALWVRENLVIGKEAPDLRGIDINGHSRRLSDARGQVVVLSFLLDNTLSSRSNYKHLNRMQEQLAPTRRFTNFTVICDTKPEWFRGRLNRYGFKWPVVWNGPDGPSSNIALEWHVTSWPSMFLIDEKGIIRAIGKTGLKLQAEAEELISKLSQPDRDRD